MSKWYTIEPKVELGKYISEPLLIKYENGIHKVVAEVGYFKNGKYYHDAKEIKNVVGWMYVPE